MVLIDITCEMIFSINSFKVLSKLIKSTYSKTLHLNCFCLLWLFKESNVCMDLWSYLTQENLFLKSFTGPFLVLLTASAYFSKNQLETHKFQQPSPEGHKSLCWEKLPIQRRLCLWEWQSLPMLSIFSSPVDLVVY